MAGKGSAPGERRGGRRKGALNKTTLARDHRHSPTVKLADERIYNILADKVPCSTCKGKGETAFQPGTQSDDGKLHVRRCQSCWGSKFEKLSPEFVGKVALEVRQEAYPKLKAIEHHGSADKPPTCIRVVLVSAKGKPDDLD